MNLSTAILVLNSNFANEKLCWKRKLGLANLGPANSEQKGGFILQMIPLTLRQYIWFTRDHFGRIHLPLFINLFKLFKMMNKLINLVCTIWCENTIRLWGYVSLLGQTSYEEASSPISITSKVNDFLKKKYTQIISLKLCFLLKLRSIYCIRASSRSLEPLP